MFRFKQYREARGLSQKFVALTIGVKAPSLSDWENGKSNPTLDNLIALSNVLNVTCDELLGLDGRAARSLESLTSAEEKLLNLFSMLTPDHQNNIISNIEFLLQQQDKKESNGIIA